MYKTSLIFGKHRNKTIQEICELGEYEYLRYISTLDMSKSNNICVEVVRAFVVDAELKLLNHRKTLQEYISCQFKPVITCLKYASLTRGLHGKCTSEFLEKVRLQLEAGELPRSVNVRNLIIDIAAKTKGRRNSNIYKQSLKEFEEILQQAVNAEQNFIEITKKIIDNKESTSEESSNFDK